MVLQPLEMCVQTQPFTFLPPLVFPDSQMDLQVMYITVLTGSCDSPFFLTTFCSISVKLNMVGSGGTSWFYILMEKMEEACNKIKDKCNNLQPVSIRHSNFNTTLITFPSSMSCWDESTYLFLLPLFPLVFKERVNSGCSLSEMFFQVLTRENTWFKFASCWKYTLVVWGCGGMGWTGGVGELVFLVLLSEASYPMQSSVLL